MLFLFLIDFIYSEPEFVFFDSNQEVLIACYSNEAIIELPASVKEISSYAFYFVSSAKFQVICNSNLQIIREYAFSGLHISSILINSNILVLESYAFSNSPKLTSVIFQSNVSSFNNSLFEHDLSLQSITVGSIPILLNGILDFTNSSIRSIGSDNFQDVPITSINVPTEFEAFPNKAFRNIHTLFNVTFENTFTSIPDYLFAGCDSLISIQSGNFSYERNTLDFEDTDISKVGNFAFSSVRVFYVFVPDTTSISFDSFSDVSTIKVLIISNNEQINFIGLEDIEIIFIGEGLVLTSDEDIPNFSSDLGNNSLEYSGVVFVNISGGTQNLQPKAFAHCPRLETVEIGFPLVNIPDGLFLKSPRLRSIKVNQKDFLKDQVLDFSLTDIETIGYSSFSGLSSIKTIIFGGNQFISSPYSFSFIQSLEAIYFVGIPSIFQGDFLFYGSDNLKSIVLGSTVDCNDFSSFSFRDSFDQSQFEFDNSSLCQSPSITEEPSVIRVTYLILIILAVFVITGITLGLLIFLRKQFCQNETPLEETTFNFKTNETQETLHQPLIH